METLNRGVTIEETRELLRALPEVEESSVHGTPSFRVRGRFLARLKDEQTLVVRMDFATREVLTRTRPAAYFCTAYFRDHPLVLIRLAQVSRAELEEQAEDAWRRVAPARLVSEQPPRRQAAPS
jgi:hypothetical protein